MIACPDESSFEWIRSGRQRHLTSKDPSWIGNFVSHLMPPFETYAKILHQIDADYNYLDNPLSKAEEGLLSVPKCAALVDLIKKHRAQNSSRIRWNELADLYKLPFQRHISLEWFSGEIEQGCWPRYLEGPSEGELNKEEFERVCSILKPFTGTQPVFARFAKMPFLTADNDKPPLFSGELYQLHTIIRDQYPQTPEYWWPADHSWCLCSDYDLNFTVIGGPTKLINSVLGDDFLESIQTAYEARIDYKAPVE